MFRLCPWADYLYAMDRAWWKVYKEEAEKKFSGAMYSPCQGIKGVINGKFPASGNSGAGGINLARYLGASEIFLLGYDAAYDGNKRHCHADHPKPLGNAGSVENWNKHFLSISKLIGIPVLNCSRKTAVTAFKRADLEEVLNA